MTARTVRLLVASRNPKKLAELRRVLDGAGISGLELVSFDDVDPFDEAPETGATFEENALAKARDGFAATGLPTLADDSGLEVAALRGMPGVLSARWSGRHGDDAANYSLLLAQMYDVPDFRRGAAFVSACAREPLGQGGFGYDPVFIPESETPGLRRSAAQLSSAEKDAVSHRGRALALLVPALHGLASGTLATG